MATFRDTIPSFLGGITQQTPALRGNNLVDDSLNMEYLPTEGATKRYPSIFAGELKAPDNSSLDLSGARFVSIERDDENYVLAFGSDESNVGYIYAWDSSGSPVVVEDSNGNPTNTFSYLDFTSYDDIRIQQVADALFLANRRVVVDGAPGTQYPVWYQEHPGAGAAILGSSYNTDYSITVQVEGMPQPYTETYRSPSFTQHGTTHTVLELGSSSVAGAPNDINILSRLWFFFHSFLVSSDTAEPNGSAGWSNDVAPASITDLRFYYHNGTIGNVGPGSLSLVEIPRTDFVFDSFTGACAYKGSDANVLNADRWILHQVNATTLQRGVAPNDVTRQLMIQLREYFDGSSTERPEITIEGNYIGPLNDKTAGEWSPFLDNSSNALYIYFEDQSNNDLPIEVWSVQDGEAGVFTSGWKDEVEDLTKLPVFWKDGAIVKLTGGTTDKADDEYIEFKIEGGIVGQFGRGVWRESSLPGLPTGGFIASTMPRVIQRLEDGLGGYKFQCGFGEWSNRSVGDEDSSPEPSFIGERIMDIFWHENRLGFLAGPNLILSESGEAYNFWRTTLNAITDADVIDVTLANMEGDTLYHALPYDSRLMVFSDSSQSAVSSQGPLSARSIEAPVLSNFRCSPTLRPVAQGRSLFFGFGTGEYSQIRQLIPGQYQSDYQDSLITVGVPQLLERGTRRIVSSNTSDALVFLSDDTSQVFVYQYLQSSSEMLMAAWGRWSFSGSEIQDVVALGDKLYFLMTRGNKTYLESILFGSGRGDIVNGFEARLDRRSGALNGVYDYASGNTTFTVPFDFSEEDNVLLAASDSSYLEFGTLVTPTSKDPVAQTVSIAGDFSQQPMFAGIPFESKLVMSKPMVKIPSQKGGLHGTIGGRQVCRDLTIHLADTGYAKATVEIVGSPSTTEEFLGDVAGRGSITPATTRSDDFRIPIHADVDEFRVTVGSDTALPFTAVTGAWTTRYNNKKSSR